MEIKDKVSAVLKIYGGSEITKLAQLLSTQAQVADNNEYRKLKRKLDNHLLPKENEHHARCTFSKQPEPTSEKLWPKQR